ncbi:hypothetical protein AYX14_07105 [Cryptococcus neoformans]|nr:hypothetical protein AYX14_07105 [Cryptococcus neoformans var. grubii]
MVADTDVSSLTSHLSRNPFKIPSISSRDGAAMIRSSTYDMTSVGFEYLDFRRT